MSSKCPSCGNTYKSVGHHWGKSSCSHPDLSGEEWDAVIGLLMGDGCLAKRNDKNPYLIINMTNKEYLESLDNMFGVLSTGVDLVNTSEQQAAIARKGLNPDADIDNYQEMYSLRTRRHPRFNELCDWYESGSKVWPDDISLTPTVLKHWYVCDGSYDNYGSANRLRLAMNNEHRNTGKVADYFNSAGLPTPNFITQDRGEYTSCVAQFKNSNSQQIWEYMGEPVEGFKYKWPVHSGGD